MSTFLSDADKRVLLQLARQALVAAVEGRSAPPVDCATLSAEVQRPATSFVTLTRDGNLRGCIGGLKAEYPLYEDVRLHAAMAALRDYRFPPLTPDEAPLVEIEISVLSEPQPLVYDSPATLPQLLRPHLDGVVLAQGLRRATFLPQVWERVLTPEDFLSMLCEKMGVAPDTWRRQKLDVFTYQVEKFTESELGLLPAQRQP